VKIAVGGGTFLVAVPRRGRRRNLDKQSQLATARTRQLASAARGGAKLRPIREVCRAGRATAGCVSPSPISG